ncbi:MAG: ATPase, T2SS/T4P/T4SS family [Lautropia sp.]
MDAMLEVIVEEEGRSPRTVRVGRFPCRVGRARDAEVSLSGWRVARTHAEIRQVGRGLKLLDLGTLGGTLVNGERIVEFGPLSERDEITVAGYRLRVTGSALRAIAGDSVSSRVPAAADGPASGAASVAATEGARGNAPHDRGHTAASQPREALGGAAAGAGGPAAQSRPPGADVGVASPVADARARAHASLLATVPWRRLAHRRLLDLIDLRRSNLAQFSQDQLKLEVHQAVASIVAELDELPAEVDRVELINDVVDEAVGLGPLERLMAQPDVTEIMVNGAADIFVERLGRLERAQVVFTDDLAIRNVIERIVAPLGRRIDESSPLVDARLPDGSRVNAIIAPVALRGPTVTIRRFNRRVLDPADLVGLGTASQAMIDFLRVCVGERKSIVVAGGTGSGKTTLLNVLSNLIPAGERLITIEDAAELRLRHEHLVALEARPPNAEGRGAVTIRDLVRNALRMRPDRIIVGECRGGEALDMLQAMNTGHEGSLTTVHANTPRDALARLEVMALMSGVDLPLAAIRDQLASAIDLIVHQSRLRDGTRKIVSITEVTGIESGRIQLQELFRFEQIGSDPTAIVGHHRATGAIPDFYEVLEARGVALSRSIFRNEPGEEAHRPARPQRAPDRAPDPAVPPGPAPRERQSHVDD